MKLNAINAVIAVVLSALAAYLCYSVNSYENVRWLITVGSFITIGAPLFAALAVSVPEYPRSSVLCKTTATIFSVMLIILNVIFAFFDFSVPFYVIAAGVTIVVFLLVYSSIMRSKQ